MKSITEYLNEGKSKISETGKKKLQKQIDKWCKDIKGFMDDYGFCKEDDYYQELKTIVWNYVADANIVDFNCNDKDTCWFIDDMVSQLSDKIENS